MDLPSEVLHHILSTCLLRGSVMSFSEQDYNNQHMQIPPPPHISYVAFGKAHHPCGTSVSPSAN